MTVSIKTLWLAISSSLIFSACSNKQWIIDKLDPINWRIKASTKEKIISIIDNTSVDEKEKNIINKKIELTKKIIWENETNFFFDFFKINNNKTYYEVTKEIQKKYWLKEDWIIWEETLKVIYMNYYRNTDIENLPLEIQNRIHIYNEMLWYKSHEWKKSQYWLLYPTELPDIFNSNYYYWVWLQENINWTYLNQELIQFVHKEIEESWNISVLFKYKWKYAVAVYIDKKIELLSYVSPGNENIDWWVKTKKWFFETKYADKYYISWAKDSIIKTKDWLKWAIMPYALHITWWIYAHAWYVNWEKRSHWCIRLPIYYAKWLYDIYEKKWSIEWYITTN